MDSGSQQPLLPVLTPTRLPLSHTQRAGLFGSSLQSLSHTSAVWSSPAQHPAPSSPLQTPGSYIAPPFPGNLTPPTLRAALHSSVVEKNTCYFVDERRKEKREKERKRLQKEGKGEKD